MNQTKIFLTAKISEWVSSLTQAGILDQYTNVAYSTGITWLTLRLNTYDAVQLHHVVEINHIRHGPPALR